MAWPLAVDFIGEDFNDFGSVFDGDYFRVGNDDFGSEFVDDDRVFLTLGQDACRLITTLPTKCSGRFRLQRTNQIAGMAFAYET